MNESKPDMLNWFDIPVTDLDRAVKFYSDILKVALERFEASGVEGALFPVGGVSGSLFKSEGFTPGHQGLVVYFSSGQDLSAVLNRVEGAGGKVLLEKSPVGGDWGFYAYFEDSEGNRIGLRSPE